MKKKQQFEKILLPAIIENEQLLEGVKPTYQGLDLFHHMELMPHQCALLSTVRRKIRAQRDIERVFGFKEESFDHNFFTSDKFFHRDDYKGVLFLVRMALFNEMKRPSGVLNVEYSYFTRCRHASGDYHLTRQSLSVFNTILHGIPIEAMYVLSDFGKAEFKVPRGLIINERPPLVQSPSGDKVYRPDVPFSMREREVLYGICMGKSSKMLADDMSIAKKTVDNMRASLLEKSGTANTAELASRAVMYSWV